MTTKQKVITLQVIAAVYIIGSTIYNNLDGIDWLSTTTGMLGLIGNMFLVWKSKTTFAFNMTNNVLGFVLNFKNRFFAEVGMNAWYFGTQLFKGIPYFKTNTDDKGEVITDGVTDKKALATQVSIGFVAMGLFSLLLKGNMVFLDSFQNGIAIAAQNRNMGGKADGWLLWIASNLINIIVWGWVGNWIMVGSFIAYAINAYAGYLNWSE